MMIIMNKVVRNARDFKESVGNRKCVIWGAGSVGRRFLQEVRVNGMNKCRIYDSDPLCLPDIRERIDAGQIEHETRDTVFMIAVSKEESAREITHEIRDKWEKAEIYRYIPEDYESLKKKLSETGFHNGSGYHKALEDREAADFIKKRIESGKPFLFSRWGQVEGEAVYAESVGLCEEQNKMHLRNNAGFYPTDNESVSRFAKRSILAAGQIDILCAGCWCSRVEELYRLYSPDAVLVSSAMMYPFWKDFSWTAGLKGKRVLVVHPFAELIRKQYGQRDKLFKSGDILPEMELLVYRAVQSMNGCCEYGSWFEALKAMEDDLSTIDFDAALLGCGAYGMPLGAFIKHDLSKQAIHMGGTLQILFGIKGKRWENSVYDYQHRLYNEYWVRPTDDLKPENYENVENGCYW